ncbi:MAG: NADP-dependent phosphogluconate dehydrogenase [Brucellaceae bacterium]|nr:NADP-dependent phosphogluconate dehydrogenase [Brucellaceae bacterium]
MAQADIGLIGLGVMGANLALNIAEKGFRVAVYNRTADKTDAFVADAGALAPNIVACSTIEALAEAIRPPRPVIMMVKAGEAVDALIDQLGPHLAAEDILIDAGNANFRDTMRRVAGLSGSGLQYVGMGVSGGEEGARHGPSIMVGSERPAFERIEPVVTAIAAKYEGEACAAWLGTDGAGHFVKTIHNGIEYADMQMIAEVYGLMRDGLGMEAAEIGAVFERWNSGPLDSYLIEITGKVLAATDPETGKPMVDIIVDSAGQKGTGRWSVIEAQMMGVPATAIEAAVAARSISSLRGERIEAETLYGNRSGALDVADKAAFIDLLEKALLAGKINAYAQGFAVMAAASQEFGWNLPMATIARIWRAGCIIRSRFLDVIAAAQEAGEAERNLLQASRFVTMMADSLPALRGIVSQAAAHGHPVPALASALGYFESYTRGRGTTNLVQAQRDFFGAHGFRRIDAEGDFHGPWAMS